MGGDRGLIQTAQYVATAVFSLVQRASVTATPAPVRVEAVFRRYEAAERQSRATPPKPLSRAGIDRIKAARKSAVANAATISLEIDAVSARISSLQIDRRRRARLPWSRWLPDRETDAVIFGLEAHRDTLRSQYGTLQTAKLWAEVKEREAGTALVVAQAEADRIRDAALKVADKRAAILTRARTLLRRVPVLAYVGAKRLLAMATRIEKAREQGYDPGSKHVPDRG